jgi:hypothetical protein
VYIFNKKKISNPRNSIEKGCHTNCVTFLAFLTTYFDEHFSGKRYFNDMLWAPAYNNNTLPDTGISSNKIYKSKEDSYGKVKGKGVMFFNWPYPM